MPATWSDEQLKALHHVLMEVRHMRAIFDRADRQMHVEEGNMTCRGCGHVYKISNGIPNMVSSESPLARLMLFGLRLPVILLTDAAACGTRSHPVIKKSNPLAMLDNIHVV
jgi:uncharacterized protein YbaR (Trm112 family)